MCKLAQIKQVIGFLQLYIRFPNSEYKIKLDKAIEVITKNEKTTGIREMVLERVRKEGVEKDLEKNKIQEGKNLIAKMDMTYK